jgi:hypothetical protein
MLQLGAVLGAVGVGVGLAAGAGAARLAWRDAPERRNAFVIVARGVALVLYLALALVGVLPGCQSECIGSP